ncbi:hypothetical protein LX87_02998 [Larkinella arboricola]|uniref:Uncharacterized protein n=1 Tax=Larkinella arboricola TaxID=643671 RepID=A0A327WZT4_LARAB|nr:hypothetical protein LX87_02998 [Larkinella arboricola]
MGMDYFTSRLVVRKLVYQFIENMKVPFQNILWGFGDPFAEVNRLVMPTVKSDQ